MSAFEREGYFFITAGSPEKMQRIVSMQPEIQVTEIGKDI